MSTTIRRLREQRGLTQAELAKRAKLTQGYISQLEAGAKEDIGANVAVRLAQALGVSMDDLIMDPIEKLQRLKTAEVLRESARGGRTAAWFEGVLPDYPDSYHTEATRKLEKAGLIAKSRDGQRYRATDRGRRFVEEHRLCETDWLLRAPLIDFP